jgi:hypothetical protein
MCAVSAWDSGFVLMTACLVAVVAAAFDWLG